MLSVHTTPEEFKNGGVALNALKYFPSTPRRFHSENAEMFSVHTTPEEFKNEGFILKTLKVFPSTLRRRNLKTEVSL